MAETFVLIHGAWHGAWCWAAVKRQLEAGGDRVFALDLPGHGDNHHDPAKVTRAMYVDSVTKFILDRDLRNVTLAGHSLGGLTISGVGQKIASHIKRLIFVSALVPLDGVSIGEDLGAMMKPEAVAQMHGLAEGLPVVTIEPQRFRDKFLQDGSRDLQDFVLAALVPEPTLPMGDPVPMKEFHRLDIPTGYLVCEDDLVLDDPKLWHPHLSGRLRDPAIRSIKSGHELMFSKPLETAKALAEMARL